MLHADYTLKDILKDGITISDVLAQLKLREKDFQKEVSFIQQGERIRSLFPDIYSSRMDRAQRNLDGYAILPGSSSWHFIGNPVKWYENIYDYAEYSYQLNRMDHWRTMAEAYSFTGDIQYAQKIVDEFYHWVEECPCQPLYNQQGELALMDFDGYECNQGIWRSLEVGIRMYRTWPYIIHHLLDSGLIDEKFLETYLLSIYQHGRVLYLITPKLWPNADHNHYLMENNGLLYLSCMFPELKDSDTWKAHAIHEMERSIMAQVTDEGGQIEGCASYHNGCTYWFALPLLLSKKYGFSMSCAYQERVKKMVEYSTHATRPCGGNSAWGDSHTKSGTFSVGAFCYYLATGDGTYIANALCYYSIGDFLNVIAPYIWEVPDLEDLNRWIQTAQQHHRYPELPTVSWQKKLKQTFLRTDWSNDALYVMFACRTPIQNEHEHIDPAGFEFTAYGRTLLGDPSIYTYKNDENRKKAKSAHWHNCLTLNHRNPWEYISSWESGKQDIGDIMCVKQNSQFMYATAFHMNYRPTRHQRTVAVVDSRFLAVMDYLEDIEPDTSVQINFHMDASRAVADSEQSFAQSLSDDANVAVFSDKRLKPHLVPAKISVIDYTWHDTMIARFETDHLSDTDTAFLSVAVPLRPGCTAPSVTDINSHIVRPGEVHFSVRIDNTYYTLKLSDGSLTVERTAASQA